MGPSACDRGRQLAGSDPCDGPLENTLSAGRHIVVIAPLCVVPEGARA